MLTAGTIACGKCCAQPGEPCQNDDGSPFVSSATSNFHPERELGARQANGEVVNFEAEEAKLPDSNIDITTASFDKAVDATRLV